MKTNIIYSEDCLKGMKKLPDESIDLVITDPPWNIGKNYGVYKDNLPQDKYWKFMESWVKEITRVTKPGYLVFTYWDKTMWELKPIIEKYGWPIISKVNA